MTGRQLRKMPPDLVAIGRAGFDLPDRFSHKLNIDQPLAQDDCAVLLHGGRPNLSPPRLGRLDFDNGWLQGRVYEPLST